LQGYHKYIPNFQSHTRDENMDFCVQYSEDFGGFIAIMIKD
jgi:hypothetical protein